MLLCLSGDPGFVGLIEPTNDDGRRLNHLPKMIASKIALGYEPWQAIHSSMRTSPGWIGAILSVIVTDLHLLQPSLRPDEADSTLVIVSDAALSRPITFQRFAPVPGWDPEVVERL